jgi:allophanate hydrolase
VNLMDLAAIAVPGPRRPDELPSGVTLLGPAFSDSTLATLAAVWLGEESAPEPARPAVELAVVGAHMTGLPLNFQLTNRGARLLGAVRTAPAYRLYALPGAVQRPGLVKALDDGRTIAAELWSLAPAALGELMTEVPGPLAIGRVTLDDGGEVAGFVCEGYAAALDGVEDITEFGGWRAYLESLATEVV